MSVEGWVLLGLGAWGAVGAVTALAFGAWIRRGRAGGAPPHPTPAAPDTSPSRRP